MPEDRTEEEIFGTPPPPENEAEEQAEKDYDAKPLQATPSELEDMSALEAQTYYDLGGQEP